MPTFTFDAPGIHFEDRGDEFVIRIEARRIDDPTLRTEHIQNLMAYIETQMLVRFDVVRAARPNDPQP